MSIAAGTRRRHPSGEQHTIEYAGASASVTQVGATLRSLSFDGVEVLDGFPADEWSGDGRGQVLAPWPNRITDGQYSFEGVDCQAPLNEPARHDAIHGLVRWLDWDVLARDGSSVTLSCVLRPQPGYDWQLDLQVRYALTDDGLAVTLSATNADERNAPFGAGFHPYLRVDDGPVDRLDLHVPATYRLDDVPGERAAMVPVVDSPWDFTRPRRLGDTRLDTAYGHLQRDADGTATAQLTDPATGRGVRLWVDAAYRYLMVYTGDQVDDPGRRRRAVAVEPMTCPPEAFRSGIDVVALPPGGSWKGTWGIRPVRRPDTPGD